MFYFTVVIIILPVIGLAIWNYFQQLIKAFNIIIIYKNFSSGTESDSSANYIYGISSLNHIWN